MWCCFLILMELAFISVVTNLCLFILVISHPEISSSRIQPQDEDVISLDKLLRDNSKQGVFEADFESENGTTISVRDGRSVILNCKVYLIHDKTVSKRNICTTLQYRCLWRDKVKAGGSESITFDENEGLEKTQFIRASANGPRGNWGWGLKWSLRGRFDRGH